jgi:hypothetical protein
VGQQRSGLTLLSSTGAVEGQRRTVVCQTGIRARVARSRVGHPFKLDNVIVPFGGGGPMVQSLVGGTLPSNGG